MIHIRTAGIPDVRAIAHHRAAMFRDMGQLPPELTEDLLAATIDYLQRALPAGEYLGWLALSDDAGGAVIGGAGVQLRRILPRTVPLGSGFQLVDGREAIVLNVYTEPEYRRRGVARRLMETILSWAREAPIDTLVLHASADGRPLYQALGFVASNEMRFGGRLSR